MIITCPWCGTNYQTFQSNCKNCGGPLPAPAQAAGEAEALLEPPPAAPRTISDTYARKLMATDALAITGFVFALIGAIFLLVGGGLTLGIITAFVGIPFVFLGVAMLAAGVALLYWRYQEKMKVVRVLRWGEAILGKISNVEENHSVSINGRHPWVIAYEFYANGQDFHGKVSTLNLPPAHLKAGNQAYVLYQADTPTLSALYPHP